MTKQELLERLNAIRSYVNEQLDSHNNLVDDFIASIESEFASKLDAEKDKSYQEGYANAVKDIGHSFVEDDEHSPLIPTDEFNIENDAVAAFMARPYPDGYAYGTGKSFVDDYIKEAEEINTQSWTERPKMYRLPQAEDVSYRASDDSTPTWVEKDLGLTNLIPNVTYDVYLEDGRGNVSRRHFKATGSVRMIYMDDELSTWNIRDLGGCGIKYGKLFRSWALPKGLTYDSFNAQILRELGITAEIDLRSSSGTSESSKANPRSDLGWKGYTIPVNAYATAVTSSTGYKTAFLRILEEVKNGGCVLFHCYAGSDRTGTLAALIEMLLGLSESEIIHRWELSSFSGSFNRKRIQDSTGLRPLFKKMKSTFGTKGETLQQQATAFWKKVGITTDQISDFINILCSPY